MSKFYEVSTANADEALREERNSHAVRSYRVIIQHGSQKSFSSRSRRGRLCIQDCWGILITAFRGVGRDPDDSGVWRVSRHFILYYERQRCWRQWWDGDDFWGYLLGWCVVLCQFVFWAILLTLFFDKYSAYSLLLSKVYKA